MSTNDLINLRKQEQAFQDEWKRGGGKLAGYICCHCGVKRYTLRPPSEATNDRGDWDSLSVCTACGGLNFVTAWPDGRTAAKAFD